MALVPTLAAETVSAPQGLLTIFNKKPINDFSSKGPIAYAVNGVRIFGPYNSGCCDATFDEIRSMDFCLGHPAAGVYHYHYFAHNTEGIDFTYEED